MEEKIISEETLSKPILIEDLGYLYPKEDSKQKRLFGIYECGFCGTHFKAQTSNVKRGHTNSCGCYNLVKITKHGGNGTKLFNTWNNIKGRTTNKNIKVYQYYGGRGITMYDEWFNDFTKFRDWALENGYVEEDKSLSIDRIDVNGNYEPSNCRWTTRTIQARNQRMMSNNTSGYRGVSFDKKRGMFNTAIYVDKVYVYLGTYKTAVEGAIAYNNYIIENNLEGFNLNIIPE